MASARGTATLGRAQVLRTTLPLQRRGRKWRLSPGGYLREIRDLKSRGRRRRRRARLFSVGVAGGEGGDERV